MTLQIPANNVRFLRNCEPLTGNLASASHALPDLALRPDSVTSKQLGRVAAFEVNGGMSELTAFGLTAPSAEKERIGGAIFVNQSDFTSRSTVFAGMPVGPYAPLPGAVFTPSLAMANLTNSVRTVTVRAAFEGSLEPPRVLGTMTLQPFETRRFEMPPESADAAAMVNILADQDGRPGDVVFALSDKDSLTAASALKPLPKFLTHANNGGGHPWSLHPGTSSTLVLFNASAKKQLVNLNLGANGIAWSKTVTLEPNQTLTMPIQQIIDGVNSDQTSPEKKIKALQGEIGWFTPDQSDVFGRVLIARDEGGTRALESYSCGSNIVLCGMGISNSFAAIDYLSTGYLGPLQPQFCASWAPSQCQGTQYGGGSVSSYSSQSTNTSTTPISGSSSQSNVGLYGQNFGNGGANGFAYAGYCQASSGGSATVLSPDHLKVVSDVTVAQTCPAGTSGPLRKISYEVDDKNNAAYTAPISVKEQFASKNPSNGTSTCNGS